jgi:hypothetical protein
MALLVCVLRLRPVERERARKCASRPATARAHCSSQLDRVEELHRLFFLFFLTEEVLSLSLSLSLSLFCCAAAASIWSCLSSTLLLDSAAALSLTLSYHCSSFLPSFLPPFLTESQFCALLGASSLDTLSQTQSQSRRKKKVTRRRRLQMRKKKEKEEKQGTMN